MFACFVVYVLLFVLCWFVFVSVTLYGRVLLICFVCFVIVVCVVLCLGFVFAFFDVLYCLYCSC